MDSGSSETRLSSSPFHSIDPSGFAPGTILAERYRIVALVGRGGMGEVYRADDLRLGQPVALKFLPATLEHDTAARDRLVAEVRNARTVSHPNVCRVYDVGDVAGRLFLTMEYIDGENLASLLRRIGRLPAAKALEIARQLCAGLAAAHDKGVLHRDLKPANVMIDGRGHARITDFGLAVSAPTTGSPADYAGTLAYMAPERFIGTPATVQSDLYGLGLILYETYTGKPAFKASTVAEWQHAHSDSTPTSPASLATDVEPAVERAILRCLEKEPAKRPASAAQVAVALPGGDPLAAALAAGETPSPELVAASGEEGTLPRAQAWAWLAACLVALAVVFAIMSRVSLVNQVPLQDPAVLKAKAQSVVRDFGYRDAPADSMTWVAAPPGGGDNADPGDLTGPTTFFYRQSSRSLLRVQDPLNPACGTPEPVVMDDVCVGLDSRDGRLIRFRAGGLLYRRTPREPPAPPVNWKPVLAAAGLDEAGFKPIESTWSSSPFQFDTRAAWQGSSGGSDYRADATAFQGRVNYFRVDTVAAYAGGESETLPLTTGQTLRNVSRAVLPVMQIALIAALAALARYNLRLGRGDRKSAFRVALVVLVGFGINFNLVRRWGADPAYIWSVLVMGQGAPLFYALSAWLYYLGFEPYVRRRWPHLLVASTRLLDGRWKDPLVGRSVLIGVAAGIALASVSPLAVLLTHLPGLGTARLFFRPGASFEPARFVANLVAAPVVAMMNALVLAGLLLTSRVILRRDGLAWIVVAAAAFVALSRDYSALPPVLAVSTGVVMAAICLVSVHRGGLLATAVQLAVFWFLRAAPLTLDVSRWYAWRSYLVVALVVSVAVWGFRNVLGKQPAFAAVSLEG